MLLLSVYSIALEVWICLLEMKSRKEAPTDHMLGLIRIVEMQFLVLNIFCAMPLEVQ